MVVAKRGVWLCLSVLKASPDMLSLPLHSGTGETPRHPFKLTAYWADDAFGRGTAGSAPERVAIPTKHFSYFCAAFTLHVKDFTHLRLLVLPPAALRQALRFPSQRFVAALPSGP